ncbi:MAG: hypothetical protein AAF960_08255 [Bacteroidota bacterium]
MTKRFLCLLSFAFFTTSLLQAQSFAWGVRGGLLVGLQKWEGFQRDPLLKYSGNVFIESVPEGNAFALFAQAGLHLKGSAIRNQRFFFPNGDEYRPPTTEFIFRNVSVVLGAKQKFDFGLNGKKYYSFGLRGDYTVSTNLDDYKTPSNPAPFTFPDNFFVRKFNYGVSVGGGLEFPLSELIGAVVDLSLNPDVSFQYQQPALGNVVSPSNPGQTISIPERKIVNVTLELSVGFRFLRIVEYID